MYYSPLKFLVVIFTKLSIPFQVAQFSVGSHVSASLKYNLPDKEFAGVSSSTSARNTSNLSKSRTSNR
jgi:hypothetical protein